MKIGRREMMGFVGIRAYRKRITDALVIVALGVVLVALVLIVSRVMTLDIPAAYLAQQVSEITSLGFLNSLLISSIGAATLLTAILIASWHETKRRNRT